MWFIGGYWNNTNTNTTTTTDTIFEFGVAGYSGGIEFGEYIGGEPIILTILTI